MDTETSDQELVAACVAGDVRAFGRLVERHHGAVAAVAFAITRDLALSEDIAQDAFVVAWTHLGELRDSQRVRAWLCGIARNLSKTELRSRRHDVTDVDSIRDVAADAHTLIEAAEAERVLRGALDELPATYREPLVLFYWQDHSIEHVASALEISAQAAQKRISRARTMIGAELSTRLDKTARDRRPAKAAAASIVAILASRGAPASAAVARTAARSIKSLGLVAIEMAAVVVACAVLGVVAWNGLTSTSNASAAPRSETPTAVERTASSTTPVHAPAAPALPTSAVAKSPDVSTGSFGNPSSYELTVLGPTRVAVALAGGQSSVYLGEQPPAPTMTRHVKGRVLDAAGKPVAGAVVVVDTKLAVMFDSFTGGGGAVTNAAGEFDVAMHAEDAFYAVALHARAGWSAPVPVARGAGDAQIELRIPGAGGMTGNVRRAGAPIEADIHVKIGSSFMLVMKTDPRGHFELPLLAPGTYHVSAYPTQLFAGGVGRGAEQDITVGGGKPIAVALEVPTGALVVASFDTPQKMSTVEYWLVPGQITDTPDVSDLEARGRDGKLLDYLVGGVDADREVQFHDIAEGKYTLCVEGKLDRDHPLPLVCKPLEIRPTIQVVTVSIKRP
jgi:RNA polymerase sigma factor (sigma-70 family)